MVFQVVGYCRVSSDKQEDGSSLDGQEADIRAWAERGGHQVAHVFREAVCGADDIAGRPVLQEALAMVELLGPDARLVVWKRNRLARSMYVACAIDQATRERVISLEMSDVEGPEAILMRAILDGFAAYERAQIILRTARGRAARKAAGKWPGGPHLPWGLVADADGTVSCADAYCVPFGVRDTIVQAFRRRADGASCQRIADALPQRDGAAWTVKQVQRMLAARTWYVSAGVLFEQGEDAING